MTDFSDDPESRESQLDAQPGEVDVRLPASASYVAILRTVTAALGARCDLTLDEIEDFRIAVDEACALLLPHAGPSSSLGARFEVSPKQLTVSVAVPTQDEAVLDRDGLAWTVLSALASKVDVDSRNGSLGIRLTKIRETLPQ